MCYCRKYAEALGNSIGTFEAADSDDYGKMKGETLRVRIRMDVREPIKRGTDIKTGAMAENAWIPVTYEKFLDFCYFCGRLGHIV